MKIKLLLAITALSCCFALNVDAQSKRYKQALTVVNYNDNVNAPLTMKERNQLKEVYGDKLQQYVLNRPQRLKDIKNILRNRIEIKMISNIKDQKRCPLLSEVPLFNYYVKSLARDISFNPQNFNPLKYNFEFYSIGSYMYRVDNTNYFIIIKSQHLQ